MLRLINYSLILGVLAITYVLYFKIGDTASAPGPTPVNTVSATEEKILPPSATEVKKVSVKPRKPASVSAIDVRPKLVVEAPAELPVDSIQALMDRIAANNFSQSTLDGFIASHADFKPDLDTLKNFDDNLSNPQKFRFYRYLLQSKSLELSTKREILSSVLKLSSNRTGVGGGSDRGDVRDRQQYLRNLILAYAQVETVKEQLHGVVNECLRVYDDPMFAAVVSMDLHESGWDVIANGNSDSKVR